jgi:MFS family permease
MLTKFKSTYQEFPNTFWIVVVAQFIDRLGGTLIFPFFALYITQKFGVGMTQAGILFGIFSISGLVGSMVGGALTDRFGRKGLVLFGLVVSAVSSVFMGLVNDLNVFYLLAGLVGLLSDVAGPAYQAMIADILVKEKRSEGFGILRVASNLAWILGPTIGGLLAAQSYLLLFILDAISSLITALIFLRMVPETKPEAEEGQERQTLLGTLKGYFQVAGDRLFFAFVIASMLMSLVYLQMYSTLSVYLRDVHSLPTQAFGSLLSINAGTVVILQFWVTRRVKKYPELLLLALGTAFYLIGFTAYGFVSTYPLFLIAMLFITFGEMIALPVGQSLAARFAPEAMRGRYMAFYGLSWAIPSMVGSVAAGLIMDNYNPRWVWYACGILSAIAILVFLGLHVKSRDRLQVERLESEESILFP